MKYEYNISGFVFTSTGKVSKEYTSNLREFLNSVIISRIQREFVFHQIVSATKKLKKVYGTQLLQFFVSPKTHSNIYYIPEFIVSTPLGKEHSYSRKQIHKTGSLLFDLNISSELAKRKNLEEEDKYVPRLIAHIHARAQGFYNPFKTFRFQTGIYEPAEDKWKNHKLLGMFDFHYLMSAHVRHNRNNLKKYKLNEEEKIKVNLATQYYLDINGWLPNKLAEKDLDYHKCPKCSTYLHKPYNPPFNFYNHRSEIISYIQAGVNPLNTALALTHNWKLEDILEFQELDLPYDWIKETLETADHSLPYFFCEECLGNGYN
jgi:hypothetical protein